jgi:formylglycine-generating enzyme required for sulfatase activity
MLIGIASIVSAQEMVRIPAGVFRMGSPAAEAGRRNNETQHQVTLTKDFLIGKYPVTRELYQRVMGCNPSYFKDSPAYGGAQAKRPVEQVSWYDAIVFCNKLSILEGLSPVYRISGSTDPAAWGAVPTTRNDSTWDAVTANWNANGYRLPTEAEWEYACRAGTTTAYNLGAAWSGDWGWYTSNSGRMSHEVGLKAPNAWGLYDMHGNVYEWCWDRYKEPGSSSVRDPRGSATGSIRVLRGGYGSAAQDLRSAYRNGDYPWASNLGLGFRLARTISGGTGSGTNKSGSQQLRDSSSHVLVRIPAGAFMMSNPAHPVTLTKDFLMGKYPVTQELYAKVMGRNPSHFISSPAYGEAQARRPVEQVSWYDAIVFCNRLSILEGLSPVYRIQGSTDPKVWGAVPTSRNSTWDAVTVNWDANGYRLPTEAEWEYACRAGTTTTYNLGDSWSGDWGWYSGNSSDMTHEVGKKTPNAWGLYDMHGNVWEWVWDWHGSYGSGVATDPTGPASGSNRVRRGGSWGYAAGDLRSAVRSNSDPGGRYYAVGLRLARNNP